MVTNETQETINAWQVETFGRATPKAARERMFKEIDEMRGALQTNDGVPGELADVYITMCQVAMTYGIDLHEAVTAKMKINRARRWAVTGEGVGQHIPESA